MIQDFFKKLFGCKEQQYIDTINSQNQTIAALNQKIAGLQKSLKITEPASYGTITMNEIYQLFESYGITPYISDEYLNLTTAAEAKKFSTETKVQYGQWIAEDHDCDNFSFAAMGYWSDGLKSFAFGIAWSDNHAFNIMIDKDKKVWIVEPQTNEYITLDDAKARSQSSDAHYWPLRLVLM